MPLPYLSLSLSKRVLELTVAVKLLIAYMRILTLVFSVLNNKYDPSFC